MSSLLAALAILVIGGALGLAVGRFPRLAGAVSASACVLAAALGLSAVLPIVAGSPGADFAWPWSTIPGGSWHLGVDALSAFFLILVFAVPALVAVFLAVDLPKEPSNRGQGGFWLAYQWLVASMAVVVMARNALAFLVAWEVMSLAGYGLVAFRDGKPETRSAGWRFLAAAHLGTAFLIPMFLMLSHHGSLEFADLSAAGLSVAATSLAFAMAVIGFGAKAGIVPFHVWLPESYAAAPSAVPAVLSGVMGKMGVYGLIRTLTMLGTPPAWWAWVLIGLGLLSGLLGILSALAQNDLKTLLAYSSVENAGIILLGLGIGMLGLSAGPSKGGPALEILGFGGALLHVLNHGVCKSALFLGAGAIERGAGHGRIDRLGGLLKASPILGTSFLIASAAICGLPPFNGFSSEFLIFLTAFEEETRLSSMTLLPPMAVLTGLALIGGLAAYAFVKAAGLTFLGAYREDSVPELRPGAIATAPIVALAAACLAMGLASPWIVGEMTAVVADATRIPRGEVASHVGGAVGPLSHVVKVSAIFLAALGVLAVVRKVLLSGREVRTSGTWDCGYAQPTSRMQYTGSSFAQPMAVSARQVIGYEREVPSGLPYFPASRPVVRTVTADLAEHAAYRPLFLAVRRLLAKGRVLQSGRVHLYVLYLVLTMFALLVWVLGVK